ncbi:MAG: 2Fe-2S iron-sulfur cluster binding domain-containing protein, partial [Bacteroidales bacterium]|nr:2Fe-2S iron-sulfur cluster binding domain-containing protein [Bacteroidales bacterium]
MLLFQSIVLISAIAVFLVVMVALVAILLFAKKKLTPQSKVKITINDKDTLEVDTGNSLMLTLKEHNIHLPSACGGGGSCGMCKCRVV